MGRGLNFQSLQSSSRVGTESVKKHIECNILGMISAVRLE